MWVFIFYLDVIRRRLKKKKLRIFIRCSLYKVWSDIFLIKPFTVDLYTLISWIPMSTNRFTWKCDCFQSYSGNFFLFLKHIMQQVKTSGEMWILDSIMSIFLWSKFFWAILALPSKKHFSCAPLSRDKVFIWKILSWLCWDLVLNKRDPA